jgi:hypothetical protein
MKANPDAGSAKSFSRPAGTETPRLRLQAVNDLPKFSRRYAAKSCVETNGARGSRVALSRQAFSKENGRSAQTPHASH